MMSTSAGNGINRIRVFGERQWQSRMICSGFARLNEQGVKYLVAGGHACILHGIVRATGDVDILIEASEDNCKRVLAALGQMKDGAARELKVQDLMDNVVKIADEVQVDVSIHAWKVSYEDAIASAKEITADGVRIPFLGLDCLIASAKRMRSIWRTFGSSNIGNRSLSRFTGGRRGV